MEKCRAQNIVQTSGAQQTLALRATLAALDVRYQQEVPTSYDGGRFVLSDFLLPDCNLVIEQDSSQHRFEKVRDEEKAKIILEARGWVTVHRWNARFMKRDLKRRVAELLKERR
jgi:very-short-patch-repair endonuclease